MTTFDFVLLYVSDPEESASFYAGLLGLPVLDRGPAFSMLKLREGVLLGLWRHDDVDPPAKPVSGGSEIAFILPRDADIDGLAAQWKARGVPILQAPADMDFGRTFTAADPDGHRIRVYVSSRQ